MMIILKRFNSHLLPSTEKITSQIGAIDSSKRKGLTHQIFESGLEWLEKSAKRFDNLLPRNWLHPERPFPKNPWFVPPVPLSNKTKELIYSEYLKDPVKSTPRFLAQKFNVSVLRVEAVLRLKHLEKKQEKQGFVLQTKFNKAMENLLGVYSHSHKTIKEDPCLSASSIDSGNTNINTPTSTTNVNSFRRRSDGHYVLKLSGVSVGSSPNATTEILEDSNPEESDPKWTFIIEDLSKKDRILTRSIDGTLRSANEDEVSIHKQLYPRAFSDAKNSGRLRTSHELWQV